MEFSISSSDSEGPIADAILAQHNGSIISVDAGRSVSDGYIKAGDYDYTIRYSFGSENPIVAGSFKIKVTDSVNLNLNLVLLKNKDYQMPRDTFDNAKKSDGSYDFKTLLNAAYTIICNLNDKTNQDLEIVSVDADISENSITFKQVKFKIQVKDLGNDAYILYTYNFENNADNATVTIKSATQTDPSEPSEDTGAETSN